MDELRKMRALIDKAKAENRDLTPSEISEYEALKVAYDNQERFAKQREEIRNHVPGSNRVSAPGSENAPRTNAGQWFDTRTGRHVRVLDRTERMASDDGELSASSFGAIVRARLLGDTSRLTDREHRAMSESLNTQGGFVVADEVAPFVVDKARALSATVKAGAQTVPMASDVMRIARITDDPTFEVKAENAAFTGSAITMTAVELHSRLIGTLLEYSEELAQDAPNIEQVIADAAAAGLAAEIDRLFLQGNGGSDGVTGLAYDTNLLDGPELTDYDDVLDALELCELQNVTPDVLIMHPTDANTLRKLKTGDGTNSAAAYLAPPEAYANLRKIVTTNTLEGVAFAGNFRNVFIGVHGPIAIEFNTSGKYFERYQRAIRVVQRVAIAVARPSDICKLAG